MYKAEQIREVHNRTGCGICTAEKTLTLCGDDVNVAVEFIRLRGQAVARYKIISGKKIPWNNDDYLKEAKRKAKKNVAD